MAYEWVLRTCYALQTETIEASFRDFLDLQNISAADTVLTERVQDAYAQGLDFADALHGVTPLKS